ncbi:MAG TPA: carboxylesterase family protein [Caulobacteraceae bacterium]|jgi:para-nitrobenzyl esterase
MRSLICCLVALIALAASPASALVRTTAGAVEGVRDGALEVYKGVPFAAPPIGPLRWREPQPVAAWDGVRSATAFAPACLQTGVSMPGEAPPKVSEDCLYLNIWAPAGANARLPVLVWIYGGGFSNGSASMPLYWGDKLARKGVIVVTVAYRVGPFGWFAHPALTAESPHHSSGNYGLEDQIAALRWVQSNIAAFGGDPSKVTIAGQSAGAASMSLLVASPQARGLFRGVIAESGGMFEPLQLAPGYQLANAEREGAAFAQSLGAKSLADLRALPANTIMAGHWAPVVHPVIEPYALPRSPYDAYVAGSQNDTPIMVGSNADEARSLISDLDSVTAANFDAGIAKAWGPLPPQLLAPYPRATDAQAKTARLDFERDLRFAWDDWAWARLQVAKSRYPVFYYQFAHAPPFPAGSVYAGWGPSHFAELWYVFDHLDQEPTWRWTAQDRALADAMSSYWTNFVKTGDPNGPGLPLWPHFDPARDSTLSLNDPIAVTAVPNLDKLQAFDAVYSAVRGGPSK